jgi:anti-sigma factor RsiW
VTECNNTEIRDALPDLLHGRLDALNKSTMLAHVASCSECAAELAILRDARASAPLAPQIDIERIVAALPLSGLADGALARVQRRGSKPHALSHVWKVAAAAIIAVSGLALLNQRDDVSAPVRVAQDTQSIQSATASPLSLVAGVQDLTDEQIRTLLAELDQIDSIPSAEPEPVLPSVDELGATE